MSVARPLSRPLDLTHYDDEGAWQLDPEAAHDE